MWHAATTMAPVPRPTHAHAPTSSAPDGPHAAIGLGQMEVHFQPQVHLEDGEVVGVEALVRWRHPRDGFLPPDAFLPAMDAGALDDLAGFVIREALQHVDAWRAAGVDVTVSVNVEPVNLHEGLPEMVANCLAQTGTPPDRLKLEITEGALLSEGEALECLQEIRGLGVALSLDDFGTGFSSLSRLHEIEVDELKVDRRFLWAALADPRARAVAGCVVSIGRELGLRVVVEGIEDDEHLGLARELEFTTGQGYLFSRPADSECSLGWFQERRRAGTAWR